jgi:calcineurin-like phosphoesterase family protein
MVKTWVCADHHFGHAKILTFKREDGTPLRPFKTLEEHDETIIANHNALVQPQDRVYLAGDVVLNRRYLHLLGRLNGRLVLVKGNHDICKLKEYYPYFDDIRAYVVQKYQDKKVIISHIPIHKESVGRFGINIHGHLHYNKINDPQYICVSLEHTDYKPVEVQEILKARLE